MFVVRIFSAIPGGMMWARCCERKESRASAESLLCESY